MAHMTKTRRSKISFSNELVDAMAEEDFDSTGLQVTQRALQVCYDLLPKHMRSIARLRFKEETPERYIRVGSSTLGIYFSNSTSDSSEPRHLCEAKCPSLRRRWIHKN